MTPKKAVEGPKETAVAMPQTPASPPAASVTTTVKQNQSVLIVAIVAIVVMFFAGFGMGYLVGKAHTDTTRAWSDNGPMFQRSIKDRGSQSQSTTDTTTPQTETN
ncbi:MAG: hypothetical protein ACM3MA_03390 [Acidobacteriota bacterium]